MIALTFMFCLGSGLLSVSLGVLLFEHKPAAGLAFVFGLQFMLDFAFIAYCAKEK
jgi:hypothetical protein